MSRPLAYLITFTCYGAWLHGDDRGSADRAGHNIPGEPYLPPDPARDRFERDELAQPPYRLDEPRRAVVLATIREVCGHRGWALHAAHVRSNHLHAVVTAEAPPERVMNDLKAYASRRLTEAGYESADRRRWTRHGSTRYLWTEEHVRAAVRYVTVGQGSPMAVYPPAGAPSPEGDQHTEARP